MDEPLVRYDGTGTTSRRWLIADERGSIVAETNASGAAVQVNTYGAWGEPGHANTGRFGYTGQVFLGEVGLYHYKARAYNPEIGRFLQTDPIGVAASASGSVRARPVALTDPSAATTQI
ncbi:MAG: RHS repeat-associated core domain-containing protein [Pseudomonadota bacterium]|nr:RHS repeat-associated core domain-containing protein [Pseudomonadota bacterium]